jgi:uncharacterized membrane protein YfcA
MGGLPVGELLAFGLAALAVGAATGLLAGLFGIGGGAVIVPILYQALGLLGVDDAVRMHVSVGSSLAIIVPTSIQSFRAHLKRGAVDTDYLKAIAVPLIAGVVVASLLASSISSGGLRVIFAVLAFVVALRLLLNREGWRLGADIPGYPLRGVVGGLIGFFSTLMGIGGGVLNNTFMTLFGRPIHQAVATSAGVGTLISIPGVIGYIWAGWGNPLLPLASSGYVNWIATAVILPTSLLLAPWGARLAHDLPKRKLEIAFGVFLLIVSGRFFLSLL